MVRCKKWDVFLGGPMEQFAPIPFYKTRLKGAFPKRKMFDPFDPKYEKIQKKGK